MRTTRAMICLGLAVSLSTGCVWLPKKPDNKDIKTPPSVVAQKATPQALVNYLNDNAKLLTSVRAPNSSGFATFMSTNIGALSRFLPGCGFNHC